LQIDALLYYTKSADIVPAFFKENSALLILSNSMGCPARAPYALPVFGRHVVIPENTRVFTVSAGAVSPSFVA
jgi:hypothetical protein